MMEPPERLREVCNSLSRPVPKNRDAVRCDVLIVRDEKSK
jgi:hypothetical protein